jgi:adenine-specific DNA-methyltransferase
MPVFDDLKAKLEELFMFDRADLDFGMYRILNAKRAEVTRFLETELLPSARAALGSVTAEDQARLKTAVETAREQARKFGAPDPDATPGVREAQAAYGAAADTSVIEEQIYSHLLTFFSRYYHQGDFIPQRRYSAAGRERYMIPYDGEEVKLVWANMEQYYIKSGESLTDYAFTFADPAGGARPFRVEFRLVAATEETANNKSQTGERRFALADLAAHPPAMSADGATLTLAFTYVEHPKGTKQADLLDAAETTLAQAGLTAPFAASLAAADSSYTGKGTRTVLRKHLEVYAAKNTFDYFIHKDLGGFLRRELDYFIKTEVLRLDDLLPEDPVAARRQLQKVHALKKLAGQIIAFLEQIENFQKKLWLKKKFVTEVRYCVTLDRIPESFYAEIAANAAHREEWKALYHIQGIPVDTTGQPGYPGDKKPLTVEFLKANPFLMVDTGHFPTELAARLIAAIPKLDESLSGVCFHSENFQALELLDTKYDKGVSGIYIDPPYNTGVDEFRYRDNYQHSSWLSLIGNRLAACHPLLTKDGYIAANIDFVEVSRLRLLMDAIFGPDNFMADVAWEKRYTRSNNAKRFYSLKDTILFYRSSDELDTLKEARTDKSRENYTNPDDDKRGPWISSSYVNPATKEERPNLSYPIIRPLDGKGIEHETHAWKYDPKTHAEHVASGRLYWGLNGDYELPRLKSFLSEASDGMVPVDLWSHKETGTTDDGGKALKELFGVVEFNNPKPPSLVERTFRLGSKYDGSPNYLDFFAGSGTTGHAVINLNREDKGQRRYILVEMGEYFETVLVPRLKKVVYSNEWKDGKPTRRDTGVSHAFKIVKLESYEDTLNNLRLPARTAEQTLALENSMPEARAEYLLRYSLELETKGSPSLLDLQQFSAPWSYQLSIHRNGETRPVTVDLVETFNWLLGLRVEQQDAPVTLTADFETDSAGRTVVKKASLRKAPTGWTFQTVTGRDRAGRLHLVLWRSLTGDATQDNAVLDAFFQKQGYNARDTEFDTIYVNGDNNLANLALAADTPDAPSAYKVKLIETEFHRLMWDVRDV